MCKLSSVPRRRVSASSAHLIIRATPGTLIVADRVRQLSPFVNHYVSLHVSRARIVACVRACTRRECILSSSVTSDGGMRIVARNRFTCIISAKQRVITYHKYLRNIYPMNY